MTTSRPNLASAFAPVPSPRGAKLEGMLAPKRKKRNDGDTESPGLGPQESLRIVPTPGATADVASNPEKASTDLTSTVTEESETAAILDEKQSQSQPRKKKLPKTPLKASETVSGGVRNVGVYLTPDLLSQLKEMAHSHRTTYSDLLLDAFEALSPEAIAKEFETAVVPTSSGMPRRVPRRRGEAGIQIQVRLDDGQTAWLDQKVVEFNAPSRSALVSTVYRLHINAE